MMSTLFIKKSGKPTLPITLLFAAALYRQEFSLGNAEDVAKVLEFVGELTVRGETYRNVLKTKDFTPIEPDVFEVKCYAPGIGVVLEENPENGERVELKRIITP